MPHCHRVHNYSIINVTINHNYYFNVHFIAGSLTKGTFIKLSAFMSNLLSALLESTMNTQTVPKVQ